MAGRVGGREGGRGLVVRINHSGSDEEEGGREGGRKGGQAQLTFHDAVDTWIPSPVNMRGGEGEREEGVAETAARLLKLSLEGGKTTF